MTTSHFIGMKSRNKDNNQELIQSNPTPHPQNQKGKKYGTHKLINVIDTHGKPNEQLGTQLCKANKTL